MEQIKVVCLGDQGVGKYSLSCFYTTGEFPSETQVSIFNNYSVNVMHERVAVNLGLWEMAMRGDPENAMRLLPLSYPYTSMFLLFFAVDNPASFAHVKDVWLNSVLQASKYSHKFSKQFTLVGTKSDLRSTDRQHAFVSSAEAESLASNLGCAYMEVSAKDNKGVTEVFQHVISDCHQRSRSRQSRFCL